MLEGGLDGPLRWILPRQRPALPRRYQCSRAPSAVGRALEGLTLPTGGCLFGERLVQQSLDVGLILRHSLAAGELPRKFYVPDSQPYAHLFSGRFQNIRSFQLSWMIQALVQEDGIDFLQDTIRTKPFIAIVSIHLAAAFSTLL